MNVNFLILLHINFFNDLFAWFDALNG